MYPFQEQSCKVHCYVCQMNKMPLDFSFDMRSCGARLTPTVYEKYLGCCQELQIIQARKDLEARLHAAQEELRAFKHATSPTETRVRQITHFIGENLVLPKCPNPRCGAPFVSFDGCCGITCVCKAHYCGWCLQLCANDDECHDHVRQCPFNPPANRSVVYTSDVFCLCASIYSQRSALSTPAPSSSVVTSHE